MSGVYVLEAMDQAIQFAVIDQLPEARAVIAELIDASRDYHDCLTVHAWSATTLRRRVELMQRYQPPQGMRPMRETERRWNAALARATGADA